MTMYKGKSSTTRRKNIVLIDKKGQKQEFNRSNKNESQIKEEKGEESINSQKEKRAMDNKDKICNCEMCNTDKGKCEKCKKVKNCDCKCNKNGVINENMNENKNLPGNISLNSNKDVNEVVASNDMMSNDQQNESIKQVALVKNQTDYRMNQHNMSINSSMNGNTSMINKSNTITNQNASINQNNSINGKTAGAVTGAMAGAGAGIVLGKSAEEEKKMKRAEPQTNEANENVPLDEKRMSEGHKNTPKSVTIDEDQNKEYSISKDSNKSLPLNEEEKTDGKTHSTDINKSFTPPIISDDNLPVDSEIRTERLNKNIVGEGHMWKRRRIFACFWHEKYFVLTKDGFLKYHKANGTKYAKGNWDIKKANRIHEVFLGSESHPYRLALICDGDNLLFGYDDPDTREFWYNQFSKFIDF